MPDGPDNNGQRTVKEFAAAGVNLASVNLMAMDYGSQNTGMGAAKPQQIGKGGVGITPQPRPRFTPSQELAKNTRALPP